MHSEAAKVQRGSRTNQLIFSTAVLPISFLSVQYSTMGVIQSVIRDVKLLVHTIRSLNSSLNALLSRINSDPGIPLGNPTFSYWQADPHTISATQSETLPQESDIVIIGSGITACSIARNLLLGYGNAKNT